MSEKKKKKKKKNGLDISEFYTRNNKEEKYSEEENVDTEKIRVMKIRRLKDNNNSKSKETEFIDNIYDREIEKEDENDTYDKLHDLKMEHEENNYDGTEFNKKSSSKKNKKTFLMSSKERKNLINPKIAEYIISQKGIVCINEKLYRYNEKLGYYQEIEKHYLQVMVYDMIINKYGKFTRSSDIDGICRFIKINPRIQILNKNLDKNSMMINCRNCVIDFKKYNIKLLNHDKRYHFLNVVNANFREDFSEEKFEKSNFYKFLDGITKGDNELKTLLQEITGYSISSLNNAKKFFIFYGKSNSGKSVYLDLLSFLCGKENISNIPLQNLNDERYTGELFSKVLNIYNELPDRALKETGTIKSLVSDCDQTICKPLYQNPFSFRNRATLIFATNNLPNIDNNSVQDNEAFFNRIVIIPFTNSISEDKQDKELIKKLKRESDIIFTWAMKGLERYINNECKFSRCEKSEKSLKKYKKRESLIEIFIEERLMFDSSNHIFKINLMEEFEKFCEEQGKKQVSSKEKENLKNILIDKYNIKYTKIHRGIENKYGFKGITIK